MYVDKLMRGYLHANGWFFGVYYYYYYYYLINFVRLSSIRGLNKILARVQREM
jgi:hypothetical protein